MEQQYGLEARLTALVLAKGGTKEDVVRLMADEGAVDLDQIAKVVVGSAGMMKITIDYGQDDAEHAARFMGYVDDGSYPMAYRNSEVTPEHFTSTRRGVHELDIVLFKPTMLPESEEQLLSSDQIRAQMDAVDLEPEDAFVTLVLAKDKSGDFGYGCLGSVWVSGQSRLVLFVYSGYGRRELGASWDGTLWHRDVKRWRKDWRFPARRKVRVP